MFEQHLLDKGYRRFVLKNGTFVKEPSAILSTMGHLHLYYFSKSIKTPEYNNSEHMNKVIIWGLCEYKKPPTLHSPRPSIRVYVNGEIDIHQSESDDDVMNRALLKYSPEEIFQAMYDNTITLTINN